VKDYDLVKTFAPVGRVESECSPAFRPRETPLFSRREEVDPLFLATVKKTSFMYL